MIVRSMTVIRLDRSVRDRGTDNRGPDTRLGSPRWRRSRARKLIGAGTRPSGWCGTIEADYNVHVGAWNSLADDADHIPWLDRTPGERSDWPFWDDTALPERRPRPSSPPASSWTKSPTTSSAGLRNPSRPARGTAAGLVVGQVQSGKTGNYTGLIARRPTPATSSSSSSPASTTACAARRRPGSTRASSASTPATSSASTRPTTQPHRRRDACRARSCT